MRFQPPRVIIHMGSGTEAGCHPVPEDTCGEGRLDSADIPIFMSFMVCMSCLVWPAALVGPVPWSWPKVCGSRNAIRDRYSSAVRTTLLIQIQRLIGGRGWCAAAGFRFGWRARFEELQGRAGSRIESLGKLEGAVTNWLIPQRLSSGSRWRRAMASAPSA